MTSFHCRSNSFPSQSHPAINNVEDHLERLKTSSSQATSTSSSSICSNLASLKDLNESINNLIQMASIQQSIVSQEQGQIWMNELLDGSLRLVDLCGFSRDIVGLTKESVQDLESSIRRKSQDIDAYVASTKRITKMINKCVKNNNLKKSISSNHQEDSTSHIPAIGKMLKEAESLNFSILKFVLILFNTKLENKKSNWSLLSKFMTQRVHSAADQSDCDDDLCSLNIHKISLDSKNMLKQLKTSEITIHEIEEGLESLYRCLVKTRVSLLNVFTH